MNRVTDFRRSATPHKRPDCSASERSCSRWRGWLAMIVNSIRRRIDAAAAGWYAGWHGHARPDIFDEIEAEVQPSKREPEKEGDRNAIR